MFPVWDRLERKLETVGQIQTAEIERQGVGVRIPDCEVRTRNGKGIEQGPTRGKPGVWFEGRAKNEGKESEDERDTMDDAAGA